MKKIFTFFVLALTFISFAYAKKVDENTAKFIGRQFMINKAVSGSLKDFSNLNLAYTAYAANSSMAPNTESGVYYYVFNINSQGFVIVSGDDIVEPILGYSNQKAFDADHIPAHVAAWLKGYEDQIRFAIDQEMKATPEIQAKWASFQTAANPSNPIYKSSLGVAPLVQTTWNQSPYYNDLCPYDNQAGDRAVTGCVATAMAQVLKYWNSPGTGAGFHTYNDPKYGSQSADFGSTTYDWANMPMILNGPNTAIATLMYHCGVSVDMTYGVAATGGSSAYVVSSQSPVTNCAEYALKTYFGYPTTLSGKVRQDYDDNTWKTMMKTDLDANRPLIYAGFGSGGGHCFVCDGYDDNGMFHFNWGWQGQFDGYFDINALNPEGVGTGGGTGGFNSGQQAIFGVQGSGGGGGGGNQTYGLVLYASLSLSASPIGYGNPFTLSTNIANFGPGTFQGTVCAAIFDNNLAFVDFVDSITGVTFDSGYYYSVTFNYPGKFTLLPGHYYMATYYKAAGGNWIQVGDYQTYTNVIQVDVVNPSAIELYQYPMSVTPSGTLTVGKQVSVHLDVANMGTTNFTGTWDVSLYNLDGSFAATIGQMTGQSLQAGYHYTNGLTFDDASLDCLPGTYLLAMQYHPDGGSWTLTGSTNYPNPIFVDVQQAGYGADPYEPNNTVGQSSNLPATFTGNTATVQTLGAACSTGTDYDFYKITLDQGFSYVIRALVQDATYGGENAQSTYTLDAIWTYSTDGATWSQTFDNVDPDNIVMNNGGTVYFQVSPKFTGKTGTYNLVVTITKNPLGIHEAGMNAFHVYPNPASGFIYIESAVKNQWPSKVTLTTVEGREVLNLTNGLQQDKVKLDVQNLEDGLYILQVFTTDGVMTKQVVIRN